MNTQKFLSNIKDSCFFEGLIKDLKNPTKTHMTAMQPKPHHCMTRLLGILSLRFKGQANEK